MRPRLLDGACIISQHTVRGMTKYLCIQSAALARIQSATFLDY